MSHPLITDLKNYFESRNTETIEGLHNIFVTWIEDNLPEHEAETNHTRYIANIENMINQSFGYDCDIYLTQVSKLLNIEK